VQYVDVIFVPYNVNTEPDEDGDASVSPMFLTDMVLTKNMTMKDIKARWSKKMNIPMENLIVASRRQDSPIEEIYDDKVKADTINVDKYYTIVYEVQPTSQGSKKILKSNEDKEETKAEDDGDVLFEIHFYSV
jgi:hypothetical protein